jgi:hypothetical protein
MCSSLGSVTATFCEAKLSRWKPKSVRRWKLTTRVYVGLVALTVITVIVAVWQWDKAWAHEWLPNFIAEWSGLFIAVVIVDRLLSRAEAVEVEQRRAPERRLAGDELALALEPIVNTAVHEHARRRREHGEEGEEAPEPAAAFLERWSQALQSSSDIRRPAWLYILANAFEKARDSLRTLRVEYDVALDPGERANIATLANTLSRDERDIGFWAEDLDVSFERRGVRRHLPRFTPDEVAGNVLNRCRQLVPVFAPVAADYRALTGQELTTAAGWNSVRLARSGAEIVARGIIEERNADAHNQQGE